MLIIQMTQMYVTTKERHRSINDTRTHPVMSRYRCVPMPLDAL